MRTPENEQKFTEEETKILEEYELKVKEILNKSFKILKKDIIDMVEIKEVLCSKIPSLVTDGKSQVEKIFLATDFLMSHLFINFFFSHFRGKNSLSIETIKEFYEKIILKYITSMRKLFDEGIKKLSEEAIQNNQEKP